MRPAKDSREDYRGNHHGVYFIELREAALPSGGLQSRQKQCHSLFHISAQHDVLRSLTVIIAAGTCRNLLDLTTILKKLLSLLSNCLVRLYCRCFFRFSSHHIYLCLVIVMEGCLIT